MHLANLGKALLGKAARCAYKGGPEAPVNKGDLAIDEATYENFFAMADVLCELEDLVTSRMRPPASSNRATCDGLSQRRHWAGGRFENDSVFPNE